MEITTPIKKLLVPSAIKPIQDTHIKNISDKLGLELNSTEIKDYGEIVNKIIIPPVSSLYLTEENKLISNYPRLLKSNSPNPYNSYSVQCELPGNPDKTKTLSGKKIVIKDTVFIQGIPLSNGSHLMEGFIPDEDATVVKRILEHGGNIIGKSKCEDLCCSANSFTCFNGPVESPFDSNRTCGGSSSGSAVLVRVGEVDIGLAGDQGGSIRIPAASCKSIGMKPTFGLIPYTGVMGVEYTIDHIGPIARTTEDIALFLDAAAGPDDYDQRYYTYLKYSDFSIDNLLNNHHSRKNKWEIENKVYYGINSHNISFHNAWKNYEELLKGGGKGMLKVGYWKNALDSCCPEIADNFQNNFIPLISKSLLNTYGGSFEGFDFNKLQTINDIFFTLILLGGYEFIFENDNAMTNSFNRFNTFLSKFTHSSLKDNLKDMSHTNKIISLFGDYIKENYGSKFYVKASNIRRDITMEFLKLFDTYDIIVLPTISEIPPLLPTDDVNAQDYYKQAFINSSLTNVFNILGLPALTIDLFRSRNDLSFCPIMVVGKHFEDHRVIQFARYLETLSG
jgi:amidase